MNKETLRQSEDEEIAAKLKWCVHPVLSHTQTHTCTLTYAHTQSSGEEKGSIDISCTTTKADISFYSQRKWGNIPHNEMMVARISSKPHSQRARKCTVLGCETMSGAQWKCYNMLRVCFNVSVSIFVCVSVCVCMCVCFLLECTKYIYIKNNKIFIQ